MDVELEIKNYRCFPDDRPARVRLRDGLTGFIGINNAGKSTMLRVLFELRPLWWRLGRRAGVMDALRSGTPQNTDIGVDGVADMLEIFSNANDRDLVITMRPAGTTAEGSDEIVDALELTIPRRSGGLYFHARVRAGGQWLRDPREHDSDTVQVPGQLWSLRPLLDAAAALHDSLYVPAVRNAIQVGATEPYYDLPLGQGFVTAWDQFKAGPVKQQAERAREVEREIGRIFDLPEFEINAASDNKTLQLFIGDKSFRLHELGAGLAQFIVVMGFAAIRRPQLILIDEPELNLHPALQLDFLTTLASFSTTGVLFATHSLGLARAAADDVYSLRRIEQGVSEIYRIEETPEPARFAGELGFGAYQELGFTALLLVEGPTDLKTVQLLLRRYSIEHRVLLLHLGGREQITKSGADRLVELQRVTDNIHVLIDSERQDADAEPEPRIRDFAASCHALGASCHVLERRAIENYFPQRAIAAALGSQQRALGAFDRLGGEGAWNKRDNWRIAAEMEQDDLEGTDLDVFFRGLAEAVA